MTRGVRWLAGSALAAALLAGAAWFSLRGGGDGPAYTTAPAARRDLKASVLANGEIQARTRVNVGTSVTGQIRELHVADGQWVKLGGGACAATTRTISP
jgi:multidrug efflux pump subunit AcrA (membrane-fusion protein)